MAKKLPKHIAQMVEKNNLVMAIKTLAEEKNISMDEAKHLIDDYENTLKQNQAQNVQSIISKQNAKHHAKSNKKTAKSNTESLNKTEKSDNPDKNFQDLNKDLDKRLEAMGYKPPMIPYWMKRVFIILLITAILLFLIWRLLP